MRKEYVEKLAVEYKDDPNCWPALWVATEGLNKEELKYFYQLIKITR